MLNEFPLSKELICGLFLSVLSKHYRKLLEKREILAVGLEFFPIALLYPILFGLDIFLLGSLLVSE